MPITIILYLTSFVNYFQTKNRIFLIDETVSFIFFDTEKGAMRIFCFVTAPFRLVQYFIILFV